MEKRERTYYYLSQRHGKCWGKPQYYVSGIQRTMVRLAAFIEPWLYARCFTSKFSFDPQNKVVKQISHGPRRGH